MQGTRLTFKSKEDATHFAEKQGKKLYLSYLAVMLTLPEGWDYYVYVSGILRSTILRLMFIQATTHCQENTSQELRRELRLQTSYPQNYEDQVGSFRMYLFSRKSISLRTRFLTCSATTKLGLVCCHFLCTTCLSPAPCVLFVIFVSLHVS